MFCDLEWIYAWNIELETQKTLEKSFKLNFGIQIRNLRNNASPIIQLASHNHIYFTSRFPLLFHLVETTQLFINSCTFPFELTFVVKSRLMYDKVFIVVVLLILTIVHNSLCSFYTQKSLLLPWLSYSCVASTLPLLIHRESVGVKGNVGKKVITLFSAMFFCLYIGSCSVFFTSICRTEYGTERIKE